MTAPYQTASVAVRVGFVLVPGFALTSFSLAIEALSVANLLSAKTVYDCKLYAADPDVSVKTVFSSNGVPVQVDTHVSECSLPDIVCICAYKLAAKYDCSLLFSLLKKLSRKGCRFVALSSGSFILAKAGILEGHSCSLLSEETNTFHELYPKISVRENLYTVSGNILTCAGGVTTLDMLHYVIAQDYGSELANRVSQKFLQERIRSQEEIQSSQRYFHLKMKSACLAAAIEIMENNIEQPCSIEELARKTGSTTRTLEHVFQRYESMTPGRYYLFLRLDRAKRMVEETNLPIATIAQATGFGSQSYFTKRFKETYAIQPRQLRLQHYS
ncbi:GlxA family transcriptional regulator [Motiliproteus sp. MSK22-1]|uniref:GlxA family transcriptional regulator n=1 Tax=Motiliproteus sp. MSK22-1 TaxID=1897630 RepID=UPI000976E7C3|nr:GlxA family transcriptional regulator [Motiliproteus sp. MSK22-1]OMH36257.1 AraC family transcriptional regulator [Motiliproteus sp. MSK22-1]